MITKGEVEIYHEGIDDKSNTYDNYRTLGLIKAGKCFGELSFFTGHHRMASAASVDFTKMYKIKRNDFINLLQSFPTD